MEKFLKIYLPLLIFLGGICIFTVGYLITNHVVVLKYIAGEAKIISPPINAVVKEDGIEQSNVKLFEKNQKFYLVFTKPEQTNIGILIIDKTKNDIFLPNLGSGNCYEIIFSRCLIQAECGQRGDYYSGEKHEGYNAKLEVKDSSISFFTPRYSNGKIEKNIKTEIFLIGE